MLAALLSLGLVVSLSVGAADLTYKWKSAQKYPLQTAHYKRQGPSFFIQENCPPDCPKKVMILSLDGGGIKGIMLARMLEHIEKMTGKSIHQLFDVIAGTSTGGIVATGLTIPHPADPRKAKYKAHNIVNLYVFEGGEIFKRNRSWTALWGLMGPKYDSRSFTGLSQHYCGANLTMSRLMVPLILTSYNAVERKPYLFSSLDFYEGRKDHFAWQASRASAAAPILFAAEQVDGVALRDGCLVANNPSFIGYKEARKLFAHKSVEDFIIVSLGTGNRPTKEVQDNIGFRHVLDVVGDFILAQMERDEEGLREKFGNNFIRIQPKLEDKNARLDNTNAQNMSELISIADQVVSSEHSAFSYLAEIWAAQEGKHISSLDNWRELQLRVQEKYGIEAHEFTRSFFYDLCKKLKLELSETKNQDYEPFSYELFFERLETLS